MIRIGTVNIDTSHAPSFAEIFLKGDDARYVAVYNDAFRTDAEVNAFIERFGLEKQHAADREKQHGNQKRRRHDRYEFAFGDIEFSVKIQILRVAERRQHPAQVRRDSLQDKEL